MSDDGNGAEQDRIVARKRIEAAKQAYGEKAPLRVEADLFVLVDAERGVPFDAAADLAQRALDVYLGSFFARRPDRGYRRLLRRPPMGRSRRRRHEIHASAHGASSSRSSVTLRI